MILFFIVTTDNLWTDFTPFLVGILGFISAILTLVYSHYNNKRNFNFLLEKDKRDREDRIKTDDLNFAKDKRERQRAYNRVLGSFLKVYHSYIKHKYLFNETGVLNIPDEYLIQQIDKIDNFNSQIESLRKTVNEESEIVPELTIMLYEILELLGRFDLVNTQIPIDLPSQDAGKAKLLLQRAHSFAVKKLLDEYFSDLIDKIALKAEVTEDFLKEIKEFSSTETVTRNIEIQNKILNRYLESVERQTGQKINLNDLKLK